MGRKCPSRLYLGDLGGNCPGGKCPGWFIFLGEGCPGGNYPRGNCPRGNCPGGEFTGHRNFKIPKHLVISCFYQSFTKKTG